MLKLSVHQRHQGRYEKLKSKTNKRKPTQNKKSSKKTYTTSVNRQIKDGVFKLLFENPENATELYYALTGDKCSTYEIQIVTITTVVSGKLKNDLAFVVKGRAVVIGEHMSSPYDNMPVRILIYTGQLYDKWIRMKGEEKLLYGGKLYKIPTPQFVVFYNGTTTRPEKEVLSLSSAFEYVGDKNLGHLELEIPVYNINKGMNTELFNKSDKLRQYSEFIAKLREFNKLYEDYSQAVKETVSHCITNDILADFLRKNGGEVMSILTMEYDVEIAKRVYADERVEDERIEIARSMIKNGEPVEKIIMYTKLPYEEIERLRANIL